MHSPPKKVAKSKSSVRKTESLDPGPSTSKTEDIDRKEESRNSKQSKFYPKPDTRTEPFFFMKKIEKTENKDLGNDRKSKSDIIL